VSTDPAAPAAATADTGPQPNWAPYTRTAAICIVAGFALWAIVGFAGLGAAEAAHKGIAQKRFALSYLTGWTYWLSLPIGGMALLMIGYLCKTSWALFLRRPFEAAIKTAWLFFLLFIPVVGSVFVEEYSPYWWSNPHETEKHEQPKMDPDAPGSKREQAEKVGVLMINRTIDRVAREQEEEREKGTFGFLSKPSFVGVTVVLFLIWAAMIYLVLLPKGVQASDEANPARVDLALYRLNQFSGPGIITFALTITAGATLWTMSLEPSWSSTMFPVIFAVNQFLTCFAFCLAVFLTLLSRPPFRDLMRPKFQLDMGTLMLAFTLFWSYTSFSQFMLVWIGNLPEEIPFYLKRSAGYWWWVSAGLIALHFALPFLLLLFRDIKLHPLRLRAVATFLCVICAIDVTWWIEPTQANPDGFPFFLMDVGSILGIGGVFLLVWVGYLKHRPLFPASQAFLLPEGHHYHGH
jgi:hypothetical protein